MPVPIKDNLKQLNQIGEICLQTMKDIKDNKVTPTKANAISRIACQGIKANVAGVMWANKQENDRDKTALQYARIKERQARK